MASGLGSRAFFRRFKQQRRGYCAALVLAAAAALTLPAELLCNHRPLYVSYRGEWYVPFLKAYPETTFGGLFPTEADYHDPELQAELAAAGGRIVFAPVAYDYAYVDTHLGGPSPAPPTAAHPLGTDDRGRDVLARLTYGLRLSLLFGALLACSGAAVGIAVGAVQGYLGGWCDLLLQRFTEVWSAQNELFLLLILGSLFQPSVLLVFVLLSLFGWVGLSSYVRAEFLRARHSDYVQAAVALGCPRWRLILRHMLPNAALPVVTFLPFRLADAVMALTALDLLGLGVPAPTPSLGELLYQGKNNLASWWIIASVLLVIVSLITLLNAVGAAVRSALDPRSLG